MTGKRLLNWKHSPAVGQGGRYRLIRLIGEDRLGEVWHGEDRLVGAAVTIRLVSQSLTQDPARVDEFRQQLNALRQRLDHPNIAWVYYYNDGEDGPIEFVVMAELGGQTLADRLRQEPGLQAEEGFAIGAAIAEGLQAAHELGFVHGTLTTQSVTLSEDGSVKIMDFGTAALRPDPDGDPDPLGPARDVRALGKILLELVGKRSSSGGADPASVPGQGVDVELIGLWRASLDPEPARRPSAESFASALRDAAETGATRRVRPIEAAEVPLQTEPSRPATVNPLPQDGGVDEPMQQKRTLAAEELRVEAPRDDAPEAEAGRLAEDAAGAEEPARGKEVPASVVGASAGSSASTLLSRGESSAGFLPRGRGWLMLAGVFLVTALVGFLLTRPEADPGTKQTPQNIPRDTAGSGAIVMPDLRGLTYADARTRLEATNLTLARRVDAQGEPGIVVATDPSLGQLVHPGTAVTLYVGADPPDESAVASL